MKPTYPFFFAISLLLFSGCSNDREPSDVNFKPALKNPPADAKNSKSISKRMQMDPTKMMLMRLDKNRDGEITKDEFPDGGLEGYDDNQDGKISTEELKKRNATITSKGLSFLGSDPDKGKEVKK